MFILDVWGTIREFLVYIDAVAYDLIDNMYNLIITFASARIFNSETVRNVGESLYIIISVFALFRLATLLINSIISPEKMDDKETGMSAIFRNFVIMFIVLAIAPAIFERLHSLQETLVKGNYVERMFGTEVTGDGTQINPGQRIKYIVIEAMIHPDEIFATRNKDTGIYEINTDTCKGDHTKCEQAINDYNDNIVSRSGNLWGTLSNHMGNFVKIKDSKEYVYKYNLILTFVIGLAVTYLLLTFALDIAIRLVKLGVLEILAPLFIVTYADPKMAKSGPFHNWLSEYGKTYASLFIRLGVLAILILLINHLDEALSDFDTVDGMIPKVILIFAILIFAKKLPAWISGLIGIKDDGLSGGGFFKRLGEAALIGGLATKTGHAAIGMGYGTLRNIHANRKAAKSKLSNSGDRALDNAKKAYSENRKKHGRIKSMALAARQSYFSKDAAKKNLENFGKTFVAGVTGVATGLKAGAKIGWNTSDIKDINAKVKADAKMNFDNKAPDYRSYLDKTKEGGTIFSKPYDAIAGIGQSVDKWAYGTDIDLAERREEAEKVQKARDIYGGITMDGNKRNKNINPVNSKEINELVRNINSNSKYTDLVVSAASKDGIYKSIVAANMEAGKLSDVKLTSDGKGFTIDGKTKISAEDIVKQKGLVTAYGDKMVTSIAKENAYTNASQVVANQNKINEANNAASNARAQMISMTDEIAKLSTVVKDSFSNLSKTFNEKMKAEDALRKAQMAYDNPPTGSDIKALKDALDKARKEEQKRTEDYEKIKSDSVVVPGMDVSLLKSYTSACETLSGAINSAEIYSGQNRVLMTDIKADIALSGDNSNYHALDTNTGKTYKFGEDSTQSELIVSLLQKASQKAQSDADAIKPKRDDKK